GDLVVVVRVDVEAEKAEVVVGAAGDVGARVARIVAVLRDEGLPDEGGIRLRLAVDDGPDAVDGLRRVGDRAIERRALPLRLVAAVPLAADEADEPVTEERPAHAGA